MDIKFQRLTPTQSKVRNGFADIAFVAVIVSVICFYYTSQPEFFYRALQVLSGSFTVLVAFDFITGIVALSRMTLRNRQMITMISIYLMNFAILAMLTVMAVIEFIPSWHFPWILPVAILTSNFFLVFGHEPLVEGETTEIARFFLTALFSGVLTWGQIVLIEHFDTWLFFRIGFIPVPLLGITVILSGLTSAYCLFVTTCALFFHPIRLAYSVK